MSAARRGTEMHIDLPNGSHFHSEMPSVAALFVIYFDVKAGYTLGWHRAVPGVHLEGVVEYKSLPSGLHNVKEDLVYFVHDEHAGLSAFVNAPSDEGNRNAIMLAVGVLVPLSLGRLGRSWRHAKHLKRFAQSLVGRAEVLDREASIKELEEYWKSHHIREADTSTQPESPQDSPSSLRFKPSTQPRMGAVKGPGRSRSVSDATALVPPGQGLSPFHPALSLADFLACFGPLVFPLHRAAMLRKRILIICEAPIQQACEFVYDLSILSSIPASIDDILPPASPSPRLRPLFAIGVQDIPFLEEQARLRHRLPVTPSLEHDEPPGDSLEGWVACSTDGVLAMKEDLFDVIVTLPPSHSSNASSKAWPKVESPARTAVKATQRDWRRYLALKRGLSRCDDSDGQLAQALANDGASDDDHEPLLPKRPRDAFDDVASTIDEKLVESLSWPALAYSSFMWWASAGEKRTDLDEEMERDEALMNSLDDGDGVSPALSRPRSSMSAPEPLATMANVAPEMALIAYFHRLTTLILTTLADLIDSTEVDDEERSDGEGGEESLFVSSEDMASLGLDVWSASDQAFVEEVVREYFGRRALVQGGSIECCGVRIC
ncbi:MAG: hypothetical protein M1833_001982 [Piccolia ochrophora]|nr:MAG: hypothetical protein M1833_001982 [Piccolia ochrophora]